MLCNVDDSLEKPELPRGTRCRTKRRGREGRASERMGEGREPAASVPDFPSENYFNVNCGGAVHGIMAHLHQ